MVPREERKNTTDEKTGAIKNISFISSFKPLTPGSTEILHYRLTHSATAVFTHTAMVTEAGPTTELSTRENYQ